MRRKVTEKIAFLPPPIRAFLRHAFVYSVLCHVFCDMLLHPVFCRMPPRTYFYTPASALCFLHSAFCVTPVCPCFFVLFFCARTTRIRCRYDFAVRYSDACANPPDEKPRNPCTGCGGVSGYSVCAGSGIVYFAVGIL